LNIGCLVFKVGQSLRGRLRIIPLEREMKRSKARRRGTMRKGELPKVIPPCSLFRLVRSDAKTPVWKSHVGHVFRIGYYSQQDGLDVIWLVNERGKYEQTTDRDFLIKYFEPIEISAETDLYGKEKPPFKSIRTVRRRVAAPLTRL
jgi:hypothetical protein